MATVTQSFSQTMFTYGPGAMLDLPEHAVIVGGLQDWDLATSQIIEEHRLAAILRAQLGRDFVLRTPPIHDDANRGPRQSGIGVRIFPRWFVCDEPPSSGSGKSLASAAGSGDVGEPQRVNREGSSSRRMVEWPALTVSANGRLTFADGGGKARPVSPVRFVGACQSGHLQDLDWRYLVHRNGNTNCQQPMFWVERGVSSDAADVSVECRCGAHVTLADLYKPGFLGDCQGRTPWFGWAGARQPCQHGLRLLSRSATNAYFPQTVTIISLPPEDDALIRAIADNWTTISSLRHLPNLLEILRGLPNTKPAFEPFSDDDIARAIDGFGRESETQASRDPRIDEFDRLASGARFIGRNDAKSRLFAETIERGTLGLSDFADRLVGKVVQVHRLREVTCLYGFTRLEPAPSAFESQLDEIQLNVDAAPLAEDPQWLPATESFGEGIFIQFDAKAIGEWIKKPEIQEVAAAIKAGEDLAARRQGAKPAHLGVAYWAIHSLSHALMNELSLDCGYPLSALKERIYASASQDAQRYGLLIYTATAGGQGTLGGLSSQARHVGRLLDMAKHKMELCSNDPVCSEHSPGRDDERPMHGAACHACLLVPETSCESRNTRLDRNLLAATLSGKTGGLLV